MPGNDVQLRVTLLGDGAVGKTSLRRRFLGKGFLTSHAMTIGADFAVMRQEDVAGRDVTYQIWDLAGQESFKTVRARFFKGSLGGMVVFDLTRKESFQSVAKWIEELWRNNGKGIVPIILVGNKSDLKGQREVKQKDAEAYAAALSAKTKEHGFTVTYIETSANTGENVQKGFRVLGETIINKLFP